MLRAFHRWPGLAGLALVTLLALTGAALVWRGRRPNAPRHSGE